MSRNRNRNNTYQQYSQNSPDELDSASPDMQPVADQSVDESIEEVQETKVVETVEIAEEVTPPAPAFAAPAPAPAITPANPPISQQAQNRIMKSVELDLISYLEAVDPSKSVTVEFGAGWQHSLFSTLRRVINNPDPQAFRTEWGAILAFFHKHEEKLFNENFMFRFQEGWKGSASDFKQFRHLAYLLIRTADPKTRKSAVLDCNLGRIVEGLSQTASANLVSFYS